MRKVLAGIAAAGLAAFLPAVAASASTTGARHPAHGAACSETWTGWEHPSANEGGASWDTNSCTWQIRGDVKCSDGHNYFGGWVKAVNLISWADCPSGKTMDDAYAQWRTAAGKPITTRQFWP